ncbi:uncharacterized protein LOC116940400 isoform X1 [Petromyzon marinus]|uniref:Uncharacterized protein LOC116940400 isoform X1 n=2 Tax=Petromyzon marinus TaxID=7757 RepID=A0AAJ7SWU9_PETMA|nr:uncharacterized protein LOC116940400 isoform X1 [Petromyzon marinus]
MEAGVEKEEMTEEKTPPAFPIIPEHLRSFVTIRRKRNAVEKKQQNHHDQHQQNQQQQHLQDYNNQHQQDHDVDHCHHDDHLQLACGSESLFSQFDSTPPLPTRTPRLRHRSRGDGGGDGGDGHEVMVMMEMFRLRLMASTKMGARGGDDGGDDDDEDVTQTLLLNHDCHSEDTMRFGNGGGNHGGVDPDGGGHDSRFGEYGRSDDGCGYNSPVGSVHNSCGVDVDVCGDGGDDDGVGRDGGDGVCEEQTLWVTCAPSPHHHSEPPNPYRSNSDADDGDTKYICDQDQFPDRDDYDVGDCVNVHCIVRDDVDDDVIGDDPQEICGQGEDDDYDNADDDHDDSNDHGDDHDAGPPNFSTREDTASLSKSTLNCLEDSDTSHWTLGQNSSVYLDPELKDQDIQCTLSLFSDVSGLSQKTLGPLLDLDSATQTLGQDSSVYLDTELHDQDIQCTLSWSRDVSDSSEKTYYLDDSDSATRTLGQDSSIYLDTELHDQDIQCTLSWFSDVSDSSEKTLDPLLDLDNTTQTFGQNSSVCLDTELKDQDVQVTLSWTESEVSSLGCGADVGDGQSGGGDDVDYCGVGRGVDGVDDNMHGGGISDGDSNGDDHAVCQDVDDGEFQSSGFGDGVNDCDHHDDGVDHCDSRRFSGDGGGGREVGCSVPLWVLSLPDMELRGALNALGVRAAPVVSSTRGLMQRLLLMRVVASASDSQSLAPAATPPSLTVCYSLELRRALLTGLIPDCSADEELMKSQFDSWTLISRPRPRGRWRSRGRARCIKNCFNYLLLDPRSKLMDPGEGGEQGGEQFRIFVSSIFYIGKGSGNRPFHHLQEAMAHLHSPHIQPSQKVARVLSVWEAGRGVIYIPCFHSSTSAESLTRESCIIDALGVGSLCNERRGSVPGLVSGWPLSRRRQLGVFLLSRAMAIMDLDGRREIHPRDLTV